MQFNPGTKSGVPLDNHHLSDSYSRNNLHYRRRKIVNIRNELSAKRESNSTEDIKLDQTLAGDGVAAFKSQVNSALLFD